MAQMRLLLMVLVGLFAAGAMLPLLESRQWWIRAFEFPRAQAVALGLLLFCACLMWLRPLGAAGWVTLSVLIATLGLQVSYILPYTRLMPTTVPRAKNFVAERMLKVVVANVFQDNREYGRLLEAISEADPDLVLAVETDAPWAEALDGLKEEYPFGISHPLPNTYGMAFFSRYELVEPKIQFLIEDDVPSVRTEVKLPSGHRVLLYGLHPRPPSPTEAEESTERDAELLQVAQIIGDQEQPAVIIGDLNDVAWSRTSAGVLRLGHLFDPRMGRGLYSTFPAGYPWLRWPLDHIFHTRHFSVVELRRLQRTGSDHLAILATLHLEEVPRPKAEAPDPEPGDREEAREVVEEAKANEREEN